MGFFVDNSGELRTDQDILDQFMNEVKLDLISNSESQNRNASGRGKSGLTVTTESTSGKLTDTEGYLQWGWIYGRAPGKFPPRDAIEQWIKDKQILPSGISIRSLAFLIQRKIARAGTNLFQDQSTGVVAGVLTRDRLDALRTAFGTKYATVVKSQVLKAFE